MASKILSTVFAIATLLSSTQATPLAPIDTSSDTSTVYLVDCGNYAYSAMAYYSSPSKATNGQLPQALAVVGAPAVHWEGAETSGIFADGNVFTALIAADAASLGEGQIAGQGANHYRGFTCYKEFSTGLAELFVNTDGAACFTLYECV